jgi:hypothetical protein
MGPIQPAVLCALGVPSSWLKWAAQEFDHSPPTNGEIKIRGAKPPPSHMSLFILLNYTQGRLYVHIYASLNAVQ